jgi:glycyl-radical enzyme activating protein
MTQSKGILFDISHFMTEDGPGIRTSVFLKGCPLRCKWCSNAYGLSPYRQLAIMKKKCTHCGRCINVCVHKAIRREQDGTVVTDFSRCTACGICAGVCLQDARTIVGREYSVEEVMTEILEDRDFYKRNSGGATFSGGEILMQADFVNQMLIRCRKGGIHTAIETSGFGSAQKLLKLVQNTDFVFMDVKAMDSNLHRELTGVPNELILDNIRMVAEECARSGRDLVLRLPLIPGMNDGEENLKQTAEFVKHLPGEVELNILPYHNLGAGKYENIGQEYPLEDVEKISAEEMKRHKQILEASGICFSIGGANVLKYAKYK